MLGWQLIGSYSPVGSFFAGVATGMGLLGIGLLLLRRHGNFPEPWRGVTAYLLGILSSCLVLELLAMAHLATGPVLIAAWTAMVLAGGWRFLLWARRQSFPRNAIVGALLLLHLAVALAPLSHQDELNYHAIVPERVLEDRGLEFRTVPWEAAVWPQLGWHVLQAPLFALGLPEASAVLSWWTALVLVWFAWSLIPDTLVAALACTALLAQGFSISQFTAMGPHAFGYLAATVAVLAVIFAPEGATWILCISATAMVAGKLTMAPAAAILCCAALRWRAWRALATALLFLGPIALWTWWAWKPFNAEAQGIYSAMKALSLSDSTFLPLYEAANWSALLWLGCAAYFALGKRTAAWWTVTATFALQALLLWFAIAKQLRFLGGIQYALCIAGAVALGHRYSRWLWTPALPWAALVLWMSAAFFPAGDPRAFLERYTGLFQDYQALDRLLPPDAVILQGRSRTDPHQMAWLSKPPAFYSPRPVLFQAEEESRGRPVYLLYVEGAGKFDPWLPPGYVVGEQTYRNSHARFYPNRTPGGGSDWEAIAVYRLIRLR